VLRFSRSILFGSPFFFPSSFFFFPSFFPPFFLSLLFLSSFPSFLSPSLSLSSFPSFPSCQCVLRFSRSILSFFPLPSAKKTKKDGKLFRKNEINAYFCTLE